jgi:2-dehydro-3-deoxyphosphogluconate aldolase/(4S)-4-hydroxy-2-oxoglutarate aldolase
VLTRDQLAPNRVVGIMQTEDADAAFKSCMAAIDGGIGTIEVSTTIPSCLDIVRGLMGSTLGRVSVGVGNVWDADIVADASLAGAAFVATPVVLPDVAAACAREGILCVLGALTPTEVDQALRAGAGMINLFPVQSMGGSDYVRWLQGPLPEARFWVSGGVEIDQVEEYLAAGVAAVGLTTALFPPDAVRNGDLALITALARRASSVTGAIWA